MTGGRQGKWKEVAGSSSFVPPPIYENFGGASFALPSPNPQPPSSRASGSPSVVPDTAMSPGTEIQKIFIRPRTHNKFDKQTVCNKKIGDLIEQRFEGPWKCWSKFPKANIDLIFSEFEKYFEWDPTQTREIRRIFDTCAMNTMKNKMYYIRGSQKKLAWLGQAIYDELQRIFLAEDFREESARNKINRSSDCDGQGFPLHVGGCVSHAEHIDRMTAKQGREPTIAEAFMHLRSKLDSEGNVKWVNERARRSHEEFTSKLSQASSQSSNADDIIPTEEQIKIFSEVVGGPRKGVIYGLAGQNYNVTSSSSSSCGRLALEWETERTQMLEQIDELKSTVNDIQTSFQSSLQAEVQQARDRIQMEVRETIELEVNQRLDAAVEERMSSMEAKLMARFGSFYPQLPRSPPANQ